TYAASPGAGSPVPLSTEISIPTSSTLTASTMRGVKRRFLSSRTPVRFGAEVVVQVSLRHPRIFSRYQKASRLARSSSGVILVELTTNCLDCEGFRLGIDA